MAWKLYTNFSSIILNRAEKNPSTQECLFSTGSTAVRTLRSAPLDPGGLVRNGAFEDPAKGEVNGTTTGQRWRVELRKIAAVAIQARRISFFESRLFDRGRRTGRVLEVWSYSEEALSSRIQDALFWVDVMCGGRRECRCARAAR